MALSADRNTQMKDAELVPVPVAASTKIYGGALVALNAAGYGVPGSVSTTLKAMGKAEQYVDNSTGANGAKTVMVRRKKMFKFKNYASDLCTQADVCNTCYIYDDETVAKTNGTSTRSAAGIILGIDTDGVWVEIK